MKTTIPNLNFQGVSDIPKKELMMVNGGMANIWWFVLGFVCGGIEDFNAGYEAAKK